MFPTLPRQLDEDTLAEIADWELAKANFCLATEGCVSFSDYDDMTPDQVEIWVEAINKRNK